MLTNADDAHASYLVDRAKVAGVDAFRFNTELYPSRWSIVARQSHSGRMAVGLCTRDRKTIYIEPTDTIIYRRPAKPSFDSVSCKAMRAWCESEADESWKSTLLSARGKFLFHPWRDRHSSDKFVQINAAIEAGLTVPDTLITSRQGELFQFFQDNQGNVVYKPWREMFIEKDGILQCIYTTLIGRKDIENKEGIALVPSTYQKCIEKEYELRVSIIGKTLLCCQILSQMSERSKQDWRKYDLKSTPYLTYEMKQEEQSKIRKLMSLLRLNFGCVDLIRAKTGELVFLEVNTNGQWLWIEHLTGLPIADTIIQWCIGGSADMHSA